MPTLPPQGAPWAEVRALFDTLLLLPAEERPARLARAAPAVAQEAQQLLAQHEAEEEAGGHFLARAPRLPREGDAAAPAAPAPRAGHGGMRLGPWALVSCLGQGGMGEVWLAERADGQFEGRAAVKLLHPGMDSGSVLARFAQERQALARLNHPHIARLLDAGATPQGRPYFVMEHVEGVPLHQAVAGLALGQRLALFLQLADAVAHAHSRLLLHRDLKPGNVLVTAEGQVKLLDFGIAKALDPLESGDGSGTLAGERPFTPHYASPEQVRGEPLSPSTDVYSLGVLLYQLLTGVRPLGREARTASEAVRAVLGEVPLPPSRLDAAVVREPMWAQLQPQLAGDLDHITMKALDKDPERRYASVQALAADLRAHLDGRPVAALAGSLRHVTWKFVRRHRWAVTAAALGLLGLAAGLAALLLHGRALAALGMAGGAAGLALALWQASRAERARARAERHVRSLRKLASRVVFDYHDGIRHLQGATAIRQAMLADATEYLRDIEDAAAQDPRGAYELARMAHRLALLEGSTYSEGLDQTEHAEASFARALRLVAAACGPEQRDADVLLECASIVADAAEFDQRQGRLAPPRGAAQRSGQPGARDALSGLMHARALTERAQASAPQHRHLHELLGTFEGRIGRLLGNAIDLNLGRWREAQAHLQASVDHMQRYAAGRGHDAEGRRQHAWALVGLASWHRLAGDPALALALTRAAIAAIDEAAAAAPEVAVYTTIATMTRTHLAAALAGTGQLDAALVAYDEALHRNDAARAADAADAVRHRDHALMLTGRGRLLVEGGRTAEALAPLREAHAVLLAAPGLDSDAYLARWLSEAEVLRARAELEGAGDSAGALALAGQTLQRLQRTPVLKAMPQVAHVLQAQAEAVAGAACARQGEVALARQRLQAAVQHLDSMAADGEPLPRSLAQRRQAACEALAQLPASSAGA
jgi:tetratricopeptide (TPR) repeat protein